MQARQEEHLYSEKFGATNCVIVRQEKVNLEDSCVVFEVETVCVSDAAQAVV